MKLKDVCNNAQCLFEREMSQMLGKAKPLVENAKQAKLQLIEHMGYELHIPLNTILGFAQLLDRCSDDTTIGEERESVRAILAASLCLLRRIDSLLDLEAIEIVASVDNSESTLMDRRQS